MRRVSTLVTVFGVIGFALLVLFALFVLLAIAMVLLGAGAAPPTQYLVPALLWVAGAWLGIAAYTFFAWGVLRTLCEIHKVLTGKLPAEQPN